MNSGKKDMTVPVTRKDLMIVNGGPHHPTMHGVLRLILTLDGEDVIYCEPIWGYLHGGMAKIAENRTIIQASPLCNTVGLFSYYVHRGNKGHQKNGKMLKYLQELAISELLCWN